MDRHKFILWSDKPAIKFNAIETIKGLDPEKVWDIVIRRHVNSKTAQQRSWFHVLCEMFADEVGMRKGDIKDIVKSRMFGWRNIEYGGVALVVPDGHSESLGLKEYSELIEILYQLAAESGIVLPPADPYRRAP